MPANPEQAARENIDRLLIQAGWAVQDIKSTNLHAGQGVAIREFPLATGHGCADYLLYVQGKAAGVIEAKKAGATLPGVEVQSAKYQSGLPDSLPAWFRPLPFCYQSTGVETHFTNGFDPIRVPAIFLPFTARTRWQAGCKPRRPRSAEAPATGRKATAGPPPSAGCSKPCRR
jgi:type I site-specific restriction endonuclease